MSNQDTVELQWIFSVIRHRLLLIIMVPILLIVGMLLITSLQKPTYEASVVLYIQPNADATTNNYNLIMAGQQLAVTYSEVIKGSSVMQQVINELDLNLSTDELAEKISVAPVEKTQLIHVSVTDHSSEKAALIANTLANVFVTHVQNLQGERYAVSLTSIQNKLETERESIDKLQKEIDTLNAENVARAVQINQKESQLTDLQSDERTLQQTQQTLQQSISQIPDSVKIVEKAGTNFESPYPTVLVTVDIPPAAKGSGFTSSQSSDQMALTYSQMVTARPVLEKTIQSLDLAMSVELLASFVSAEPITGTQLIKISLASSSSEENLTLANTLAQSFIEYAQTAVAEPYKNQLADAEEQAKNLSASIDQAQSELETLTAAKVQAETDISRLNTDLTDHLVTSRTLQTSYDQMLNASTNATDTVVIAESASAPISPINHRFLYALVCLGLGALIGVGLAFLQDSLDKQILTKQDLTTTLGLSYLGSIGKIPQGPNELVIQSDPDSPAAEDFRVLGTNIRLSTYNNPLHKLLITSPTPDDGKSMIIANLSVALAQMGLKVIVVDADLRLPRQQQIFHCSSQKGLTGALLDNKVDGSLQTSEIEGLSILTSGHIPPDPTGILNSPQLARLLDSLTKKTDIVVIDSPAILAAADTTILSTLVDGVLVVARAGHTRSEDAKEAVSRLYHAKAPIIGVVLNDVVKHRDRYGYYRREEQGWKSYVRMVRDEVSRWGGRLSNHRKKVAEDQKPSETSPEDHPHNHDSKEDELPNKEHKDVIASDG